LHKETRMLLSSTNSKKGFSGVRNGFKEAFSSNNRTAAICQAQFSSLLI